MNEQGAWAVPDPLETVALAPASGLLDLSRQQRNLLLLRPLFQLELNKQRIGEDGNLFEGVDTHYLLLSALDLMMEGTTVSTGCTGDEVFNHLADTAAAMKPSLSKAQLSRRYPRANGPLPSDAEVPADFYWFLPDSVH